MLLVWLGCHPLPLGISIACDACRRHHEVRYGRIARFWHSAALSHEVLPACREPGLLSPVITATEAMPVVESEGDLRLGALETLAAEQSAQGQPPYVAPDDRYGLFPSSAVPAAPTLRTQQYANPTASAAAVPAPAVVASPGVGAAAASSAGVPTRAGKPPPRPRAQMGTFSHMMMARPESPSEAPPASTPAPAAAAAAAAPARKTKGPFAPNVHTFTEEGDGLADMLFGGTGGGSARKPRPATVQQEAPAAPAPPPLMDLLGGFDDVPAASSPSLDMPTAAMGDLGDLLGGGDSPPAAPPPADDLLAGLDSMHIDAAPAPSGGDPFGDVAPGAAPADPMSGLDMLSMPAPAQGGGVPFGTGGAAIGVQAAGMAAGPPGYGMPYGMPQMQGGEMAAYGGMPGGAIGGPPQMSAHGMPGMHVPGMDPMQMGGVGAPGPEPTAEAGKSAATLQAKVPDKKGDAFADLLSF